MAQLFPYAYYSCPCVDPAPGKSNISRSGEALLQASEEDDDEHTFDLQSPRANYTLFPLEHLLYCTDCHQIRCPRCTAEEIVCWYCPNCLFEVPSSTVRSDGNRCTRNCYNCPICTSILSISSLEKPVEGLAPPEAVGDATKQLGGPFFLSCPYCQWSSLDIGIQFEKHFNLTGQLQKLLRPPMNRRASLSFDGMASPTSPVVTAHGTDEQDTDALERRGSVTPALGEEMSRSRVQGDTEAMFSNLQNFYRSQSAELEGGNKYTMASDYSLASPSSIHRLMNLYSAAGRAKHGRPQQAREAAAFSEGLKVHVPASDKDDIARIQSLGWSGTASVEQRREQCREDVHFTDQLRPQAALLRTKKSKRCKICRQILSRPESKISSNRYKIKLLALNNIPKINLRPANASSSTHASFPMQAIDSGMADSSLLRPLAAVPFLLTVHNPLFDPIRVTLATPSITPGRVKSKVTILCPEFEVGANTDVWDEALNASASAESRRTSQLPSLAGDGATQSALQAEAGKVWAKGRNWTSVVVEIVPGMLPGAVGNLDFGDGGTTAQASLDPDEDVLEISVFVRLEYETEAGGEETSTAHKREESGKEKREEAFWAVLGAGRIAS